jgi:hypothetical protein
MRAVLSKERWMTPDDRETLILKFARDRVIAHQSLFVHRHPHPTPRFHDELIELWHSGVSRVLVLAFRGGGKSTLAEEALVLGAAMKLVRNAIVIGSSFERAVDRLRAIKHELATNELLIELFGDLRGPVWNEGLSATVPQRWGSRSVNWARLGSFHLCCTKGPRSTGIPNCPTFPIRNQNPITVRRNSEYWLRFGRKSLVRWKRMLKKTKLQIKVFEAVSRNYGSDGQLGGCIRPIPRHGGVRRRCSCPSVHRYRSTRLPTDTPLLPRRYYRPYGVPSPTASTSSTSKEEKKHPIHKREETHHHGNDGPPPGPTPVMRAAGAQGILQKRLGK